MKEMVLCLAVGVLPIDQDRARETEARIERAIGWLLDDDPELRAAGRKTLLEIGAPAVPYLERRLTRKGIGEIYGVLKILLAKTVPEDLRWVEESDLPTLVELQKKAPKPPQSYVDRFVYHKYYEAYLRAKSGNYQRAIDMANALLLLEPKSKYGDEIRKLRRYGDHRLTQTTLLETRVVLSKPVALSGDKVRCLLRVRNVRESEMTLGFDPKGRGFAIVNLTARVPTPKGDVHESTRTQEVYFPNAIKIAGKGEWEQEFLLDTGSGLKFTGDIEMIVVSAWMMPRRIDLGAGSLVKRIVFESARLKVVPRRFEKAIARPLEALTRAMASGTVNDVFVIAHMLEGEEKQRGIGMLVEALKKSRTDAGRAFLCRLLQFLTGKNLGNLPRRWIEWWESSNRSKGS